MKSFLSSHGTFGRTSAAAGQNNVNLFPTPEEPMEDFCPRVMRSSDCSKAEVLKPRHPELRRVLLSASLRFSCLEIRPAAELAQKKLQQGRSFLGGKIRCAGRRSYPSGTDAAAGIAASESSTIFDCSNFRRLFDLEVDPHPDWIGNRREWLRKNSPQHRRRQTSGLSPSRSLLLFSAAST